MNININKEVFDNIFNVHLNMNDVFFFACSYSAEIPGRDFRDLVIFYEEYGYELFVAYESLVIECDPENPGFQGEEYFKAKKFLQDKINIDKDFCFSLQQKLKLYEEEKTLFDGQMVQYKVYKLPWYVKLYLKLRRKNIYVVSEAYLESGEFARGFNQYKAKAKLIEKYKGKGA